MTIQEIQNEVVEEFELFTDWTEKYSYIIELGKKLDVLEEHYKTEGNIIKGCQSRVWLQPSLENGKVKFDADSDAIIVKGIVYLLIRVLSNHTPEEILSTELTFIEKIGLTQHLSPTRSNGLLAMVKQIKFYALAYKSKLESEAK